MNYLRIKCHFRIFEAFITGLILTFVFLIELHNLLLLFFTLILYLFESPFDQVLPRYIRRIRVHALASLGELRIDAFN